AEWLFLNYLPNLKDLSDVEALKPEFLVPSGQMKPPAWRHVGLRFWLDTTTDVHALTPSDHFGDKYWVCDSKDPRCKFQAASGDGKGLTNKFTPTVPVGGPNSGATTTTADGAGRPMGMIIGAGKQTLWFIGVSTFDEDYPADAPIEHVRDYF